MPKLKMSREVRRFQERVNYKAVVLKRSPNIHIYRIERIKQSHHCNSNHWTSLYCRDPSSADMPFGPSPYCWASLPTIPAAHF